MKRYDKPVDLIIQLSSSPQLKKPVHLEESLQRAELKGAKERSAPSMKSIGPIKAKANERVQVHTDISDLEVNPWDVAHASLMALGPSARYIEPGLWNEYVFAPKQRNSFEQIDACGVTYDLAQLVFFHPELAALIDYENRDYSAIGKRKWISFVQAVIAYPETSITLRNFLKEKYSSITQSKA